MLKPVPAVLQLWSSYSTAHIIVSAGNCPGNTANAKVAMNITCKFLNLSKLCFNCETFNVLILYLRPLDTVQRYCSCEAITVQIIVSSVNFPAVLQACNCEALTVHISVSAGSWATTVKLSRYMYVRVSAGNCSTKLQLWNSRVHYTVYI